MASKAELWCFIWTNSLVARELTRLTLTWRQSHAILRGDYGENSSINKVQFLNSLQHLHRRCKPGSHFTKVLWAHNPKLANFHASLTRKIILSSGHNFVHVTTAWLSWHVQIRDLITSSKSYLKESEFCTRFHLWGHKVSVKWVQGYKRSEVFIGVHMGVD